MTYAKRVLSSAMLGTGVLLVFVGLSAALGFSAYGMLASVAAIATLLYAGGVWFGALSPAAAAAAPAPIVVFDRTLTIAFGGANGTPVASQFPESMRREIESRCGAVFLGQSTHFTCEQDGRAVGFDVAPVRAADGTILYGILITGTAAPASAVAACIAS